MALRKEPHPPLDLVTPVLRCFRGYIMESTQPAPKRARARRSPPDELRPHVVASGVTAAINASTAALNEVRAAQPPRRRSKRARPRAGAGNSPYYPSSGSAHGEALGSTAPTAPRSLMGASARDQPSGSRAPSPIQTGQHRRGAQGTSMARGTGRSQAQSRPRQVHPGAAGPGRPRSGPASRRPVAVGATSRGRGAASGPSIGRSATTGSVGIPRRRGGNVASSQAVTAHSSLYESLQSLRAGRSGSRVPPQSAPVAVTRLPGVHYVQHADIPPVMDGLFATLRRHELEYRALPDAFVRQPNLQPYMRMLLLEWMMEVCQEYRLKRETFHLAVNFTDRFVSLVSPGGVAASASRAGSAVWCFA